MPMIRAHRMLSALEAGTLSSAALQTLLTSDASRQGELAVLLNQRGNARRVTSSPTTISALLGSSAAAGIFGALPNAIAAAAENNGAMAAVAGSSAAVSAIVANQNTRAPVLASRDFMRAMAVGGNGAALLPYWTWVSRATAGIGGSTLNMVRSANDRFFAAGDSNGFTSTDGITWTAMSGTAAISLKGVVYGNGIYVRLRNEAGPVARTATSTNGIDWTEIAPSGLSGIQASCLEFGNGVFVAGGNLGEIYTSTNGTAWTSRTSQFAGSAIMALKYANGVFVAVGASGKISTSPDGTTWTARTSGTTSLLNCVEYINGVFFVGGSYGAVVTSPNGTAWTNRSGGVFGGNSFYDGSAAVGGGLAVLRAYSAGEIYTSTNGTDWTAITYTGAMPAGYTVAFANGLFVSPQTNAIVWTNY